MESNSLAEINREEHRQDFFNVILRANPHILQQARPILDSADKDEFGRHLESLLAVWKALLKADDDCDSDTNPSHSCHSNSTAGIDQEKPNSPRKMFREIRFSQANLFNLKLYTDSNDSLEYLLDPTNFGSLRSWLVGDIAVPSNCKTRFPHLFLHPHAPVRTYWSIVMICSVLYFTIMLPLRLAFDQNISTLTQVFELFFLSLFFVDMLQNFFTLILDGYHHDRYIYDFKTISYQYLRGWFVLDLLSLFPLSLCLHSTLAQLSGTWRFVAFIELIQLLRLSRLSNYLSNMNLSLMDQDLRLLKFIIALLLGAHVTACIWVFIASIQLESNEESWLMSYDIPLLNNWDAYITSFYFASMTMTSVGFGDVYPASMLEKVFSIILMAFSVTVFAYFIANVSSILSGNQSTEVRYKDHLRHVQKFMTDENLPPTLQTRILSYFDYCYQRTHKFPFNNQSIMQDLSPSLQNELTAYLNKDLIARVPFFRNRDIDFIRSILQVLKSVTYAPWDVIINEGDIGEEMFFIRAGTVVISRMGTGGKLQQHILEEGDYFGELSVLLNSRRTATVSCMTFCELYSLHKRDLEKILLDHPTIAEEMRKYALKAKYVFKQSQKYDFEKRWLKFSLMVDNLMKTKYEDAPIACTQQRKKPSAKRNSSIKKLFRQLSSMRLKSKHNITETPEGGAI